MGIAISALEARKSAQSIALAKRVDRFDHLAETKFKSIFMAIRSKMSVGEMYVPAVGVPAKDMEEFKEVMSYFGYVIQCQSGKCEIPDGNWVAVYSIWFNQ